MIFEDVTRTVGNTPLVELRPYFLVGAAVLLLSALYLTFARPQVACAGSVCSRPAHRKDQKVILVIAMILALLAAAFPYFSDRLF